MASYLCSIKPMQKNLFIGFLLILILPVTPVSLHSLVFCKIYYIIWSMMGKWKKFISIFFGPFCPLPSTSVPSHTPNIQKRNSPRANCCLFLRMTCSDKFLSVDSTMLFALLLILLLVFQDVTTGMEQKYKNLDHYTYYNDITNCFQLKHLSHSDISLCSSYDFWYLHVSSAIVFIMLGT